MEPEARKPGTSLPIEQEDREGRRGRERSNRFLPNSPISLFKVSGEMRDSPIRGARGLNPITAFLDSGSNGLKHRDFVQTHARKCSPKVFGFGSTKAVLR